MFVRGHLFLKLHHVLLFSWVDNSWVWTALLLSKIQQVQESWFIHGPIIHDATILNNGIYILRSIKVMGNGVPEYFNHFKNGPYPRIAGWTFYFYWENLDDWEKCFWLDMLYFERWKIRPTTWLNCFGIEVKIRFTIDLVDSPLTY